MLSQELLEKVLNQAQTSACHSWEYGTVFEALLEYYNPSTSVFHDPFPDNQPPILIEEQVPALKYVNPFILTDSEQLCEGNGRYLFLYLLESHFKKSQLEIYDLRSIYHISHEPDSHQPEFAPSQHL
jgi:hypothetical protein